jgi:hypothetical protein
MHAMTDLQIISGAVSYGLATLAWFMFFFDARRDDMALTMFVAKFLLAPVIICAYACAVNLGFYFA